MAPVNCVKTNNRSVSADRTQRQRLPEQTARLHAANHLVRTLVARRGLGITAGFGRAGALTIVQFKVLWQLPQSSVGAHVLNLLARRRDAIVAALAHCAYPDVG